MDLTKKFKKAVENQGFDYNPDKKLSDDFDTNQFNLNSSELLKVRNQRDSMILIIKGSFLASYQYLQLH